MAAYDRLEQLSAHLKAGKTGKGELGQIGVKSPNDIVIVAALRTPITRARKGPLAAVLPEEYLAQVLAGVCDQVGLDKKLVEDVQVGNVLPPGGGANAARVATLAAGFPSETSVSTVNRQCSSGLQAVATIASSIKAGYIDIGIGAGVESMTKFYGAGAMSEISDNLVESSTTIADVLLPMGLTSENVAADYKISRAEQDAFAAESHRRAAKAWKEGHFDEEVLKIKVKTDDGEVIADRDDGIREGTTKEALAKLKPAFSEDGTTTAGNASQVSDGAAAVLLMRRSTAEKLKLPIKGKLVTFAVVGVPPRVMGIGPAYAIPIALHKAGITKNQVDVFEINEAFASQAVYCIKKLGLDPVKVNPKGGAIAFGHPLGTTGARQVATLLTELKRTGKKVGVTSMCIGTGMGAAAVFEAEY
ncbi:3-ketoacyl-CoA thiolase peroxisomal A precursor [Gonapodya prolifera JEL478]|uniref:acetyl-CoA C-acyltransferase n=1 Tax=Gonapodya prolifera (strain JEL478) TaxID=1344416 RepID=A0A139A501_GONPJ|nr:3-ketoacyl-CoA thiolase peroxisomal A precursor [Gonapodya prolifera JEL478]|eukprot:KXS11708.1 3-ketoacyl-CoA thiolase peroxisomal A precursor [Gonapodya prolifera JEL478]